MRTVIAGGSGFLGQALASALANAGHRVQILTRRLPEPPPAGEASPFQFVAWTPDGTANGSWTSPCAGADLIVNLAGASIGDKRWTPARKAELRGSRIYATRSIARFIAEAEQPPAALISASAVGIYGDRGAEKLTEDAKPGQGFLGELAVAWEQEAMAAESARTRVVLLRTGIVLDPLDGALAKMIPPFQRYAGGPFGSGRQYMSWIHRDDWVSLAKWAVETPALRGPVNLTAPNPGLQRGFRTRTRPRAEQAGHRSRARVRPETDPRRNGRPAAAPQPARRARARTRRRLPLRLPRTPGRARRVARGAIVASSQ